MRHRLFAPKRLRSALRRVAGVLAITTLLFATLFGAGKRYFFCAAMDRVFADHACCDGFEVSLEDQIRGESQGMAVGEDERCCESRVQGLLPDATGAAEAPDLHAAWTAILPAPIALDRAPPSPREARLFAVDTTGPPPLRASEICAKNSVYLI